MILRLVNAGGNVNVEDHDGWTPLYHCLVEGEFDVAEYLINCGADIYSEAVIDSASIVSRYFILV